MYDELRDARFFASCVDGVRDLAEIGPDRYAAVFETKVAYMKFSFKVTVEVTRADPPQRDRGQGRRHAARHRRPHDRDLGDPLTEVGDETKIAYEVDAALTGKLGSLGQPVLRSKAREMEKHLRRGLRAAFEPDPTGAAS